MGLPSSSQNNSDPAGRCPGRVLKPANPQVSSQTQSQIWRGIAQNAAFTRAVRRPGDGRGGDQGLTSLPPAPYPELQVEAPRPGPPSLCPLLPLPWPCHCQSQLHLSGTASCHLQAFAHVGLFAGHTCPTDMCPNPPDHCGGSVPLGSSTLGHTWGLWPSHPSGWIKTPRRMKWLTRKLT